MISRSDTHEPMDPLADAHGRVEASRRIGRVLRVVGGAFLLASASSFLLNKWEEGTDLLRYGMLLLNTVLLVVAALFCGFNVKDSRGARTFLGLVLAIIPINAAVVGGLLYSQFAMDSARVTPVGEFVWVAPSPTAALLCAVLSTVVLVPIAWFSFRTLVRTEATRLLAAFVLTNALVLIPWREPEVTAVAAVVAILILSLWDARGRSKHASSSTFEGRIARGTLFLPIALGIARGVHLYPSWLLHLGAICLGVGIWLATLELWRIRQNSRATTVWGAVVALSSGWLLWWAHWNAAGLFADVLLLPTLLLPLAGILALLSGGIGAPRSLLRATAALLVLIAVIPNLWTFPSVGTSLACAVVGSVVLAYGAWTKSRYLSFGGSLAVIGALLYQIVVMVQVDLLTHWMSLSILGMLLIVVASYWEKYQAIVMRRIDAWSRLARQWDY